MAGAGIYASMDDGVAASYGITSSGLVIKSASGRVIRISVIVAGSAVGAVYDFNSLSSPQNQIAVIPNSVGVIEVRWPVTLGITVVPGTGQTVAVSYS